MLYEIICAQIYVAKYFLRFQKLTEMDNKTLIDTLAKRLNRNKNEVSAMIDSLSTVIKNRCVDMDIVAIPGFGSFEAKKRLERITVHPQTGKRLLVPPKITMTFKPSALLKQKLKDK